MFGDAKMRTNPGDTNNVNPVKNVWNKMKEDRSRELNKSLENKQCIKYLLYYACLQVMN